MFDAGGVDVLEAVRRLGTCVPEEMSAAECHLLVLDVRRVQNWMDGRLARVLGAMEAARRARDARPAGGSEGKESAAEEDFRASTNTSSHEARKRLGTARHLPGLPVTQTALERGDITLDHANAMAGLKAFAEDLAGKDPAEGGDEGRMVQALQDEEQRLVGMARNLSPEAFARYLYKWRRSHMPDNGEAEDEQLRKESFVKRWTRHDGLRGTTIGLDPERDAELHKALDVVMEQLWRSQNPAERDVPPGLRDHHGLRADALMELVRRGMGASVEHGRRSTGGVMALVDLRTLLEGLHPGSVCELDDGTPISPATARRLACEQGVIPVVLGSKGRPLDVGEPVRLATWQQRIALRALYDSCAAEGCDRPFDWCQVHHVDPWARSRNGKLENLVPLCTRHHHQVHQDRWRLTRDPGNGKVTYRRIDATAGAGPPCDQPPDRPPDRPRPPTSSGSEAMGARRAANPATGGRTTAPTLPLDAA